MRVNKITALILTALAAICLSVSFAGCSYEYCDTLDEATALEIKTVFYNERYSDILDSPEDVPIDYFYGGYRNTFVVDVGASVLSRWYSIVVDGVVIEHPSANPIYACNNGKLYKLDEAFANKLLKHRDLVQIKELCRQRIENKFPGYFDK